MIDKTRRKKRGKVQDKEEVKEKEMERGYYFQKLQQLGQHGALHKCQVLSNI